jgi:hypothetical protein
MSNAVDARVMVGHSAACRDGAWIFSSTYTERGEDTETVCCDRLGRRNNGGAIYYVLRCNQPWHCNANARVRKGALRAAAVLLISEEDL